MRFPLEIHTGGKVSCIQKVPRGGRPQSQHRHRQVHQPKTMMPKPVERCSRFWRSSPPLSGLLFTAAVRPDSESAARVKAMPTITGRIDAGRRITREDLHKMPACSFARRNSQTASKTGSEENLSSQATRYRK